MKFTDEELLAAVEQSIRETAYSMGVIKDYSTPDTTDKDCTPHGGSGPRIAYILQQAPPKTVHGKLMRLKREGKVYRPAADARGSAVRWWPIGLLDKLRAEWKAEA